MVTPLTNEQKLALIRTILLNTLDLGVGEMDSGYSAGIIDAILAIVDDGYAPCEEEDEYDDDV